MPVAMPVFLGSNQEFFVPVLGLHQIRFLPQTPFPVAGIRLGNNPGPTALTVIIHNVGKVPYVLF